MKENLGIQVYTSNLNLKRHHAVFVSCVPLPNPLKGQTLSFHRYSLCSLVSLTSSLVSLTGSLYSLFSLTVSLGSPVSFFF